MKLTNRKQSAFSTTGFKMLSAAMFSVALDLGLSRANGYLMRTDAFILLMLNALFILLPVILMFSVVLAMNLIPKFRSRVKRIPWSWFLLAAILPIGVATLNRFHDFPAICVHGAVAAGFLIMGYFEAKSRWAILQRILSLTVLGTVLISIVLIIHQPLPGRSMLAHAAKSTADQKTATAAAPNLLLIVLDTMRFDHLEVYGYSRKTAPWLMAFSKNADVFDYAFSSSSYTLPSHATLFTGLHPRSHGADIIDSQDAMTLAKLGRLDDEVPVAPLESEALTLAEIAKDRGLETGAICGNTAYLYRYFGFSQGFDTYVDKHPLPEVWRPAGLTLGHKFLSRIGRTQDLGQLLQSNERFYLLGSEVTALALEWLESRRDRRFFLFLNYNDPHAPYLPIGKYKNFFPHTSTSIIDAYDAEVVYMDAQIAALFRVLETWALLDSTLVVIVADHGESFSEHEKEGHGATVYEPEIHIPLLLRRPGQGFGRRVERFVHLVDIFPTILDLMGFERPPDLQGNSLYEDERLFPIVSYLGKYYRDYEEYAICRDPWKLIRRTDSKDELYDIRKDTNEIDNLAGKNPETIKEMSDELQLFFEDVMPRFQRKNQKEIDKETKELLRSLGYIK